MNRFDYLIIGSGLIGSTTAIALAQKTSQKIALVDSGKIQAMKTAESPLDTRTLALNHASVEYLKSLHLWQELEEKACPIYDVDISEKGAFGRCRLSRQDVDSEALGYVIEISHLQKTLMQALTDFLNIQLFPETNVESIIQKDDQWQIKISESYFDTKTLILAGGTHSPLRNMLEISTEAIDYHQTAIVAVAACAHSHQHTAYERFDGGRTLAILPLTENRVGTVLSVPNHELSAWLTFEDQIYLKKIEAILGNRFGHFTALGPRQHYPLQLVIAEKFVKNSCILLGNVAHTLNPIGAQGFNLGLAGVKDYVDTLNKHVSLEAFEMRQRARCERLKKFTHQTVRLFNSGALPTRLGRSAALFLLQHSDVLKKRFIRRMMGND